MRVVWGLCENIVSAPGLEFSRGTNTQQITVTRYGNSDVAAFYMRPKIGLHGELPAMRDTLIFATLFHNGAFVARLSKPITITDGQKTADVSLAQSPVPSTPVSATVAARSDTAARVLYLPAAAPTLTITENRVNNVLDINFNFSSEGTIEKNIDDASTLHMWINAHYAKMARYGRGFRPEHAETTLQSGNDYLNAFGRELYDKVVPEELQGVLYKALTDKRHPSIQVISDDPAIPWELIRIMDPQTHQRLLPLGELVSIARWPMSKEYVPRTHSMEASRSVVVAPQYSGGMTLAETTQELDAVLHTPTFQAMDGSYTSVRALAANPPQGFLHFAGHGEVIQEDGVTQYSILLKDGAIGPETWASLKAPNAVAGTLYFFNACEVGKAGQFMNEVDGWAPALLGSGASGFIGALWPISDSTATLFATEFYKQLTLDLQADQQGAPISDVLTATRRQVFEQTHDPTALAYVFYGDPNLRVTAKIQ